MEVYKRMYAVLCGAVDEVIDPLERIPLALPWTTRLRSALLEAEELFIESEEANDPAEKG